MPNIHVSRDRLGEQIEVPVAFTVEASDGFVNARGSIRFEVVDEGVIAIAYGINYSRRHHSSETITLLLLSIKHWCQSNDIATITVSCSNDEVDLYHSHGFNIPKRISLELSAAAE